MRLAGSAGETAEPWWGKVGCRQQGGNMVWDKWQERAGTGKGQGSGPSPHTTTFPTAAVGE